MAALRRFETPSDHRFEIRDVYRFDYIRRIPIRFDLNCLVAVPPTSDAGEANRSQLFPGRAPGYEEFCGEYVDGFLVLIEHRATHGHDALMGLGARWRDLDNFTFDV